MNRLDRLAILVVDDQPEVLDVYRDVLCEDLGHWVECVTMPAEALRLAQQHLFDVVLIDAKLSYKAAPLGGLLLAEEIGRILGVNSIIVMSQYDLRNEVMVFNSSLPFLSKPTAGISLLTWAQKDLMGKIRSLIKQQIGFVVMPFGFSESNEWYRSALQPWMSAAGFTVKRMDEIQHTRAIDHELLEKITECHFVVLYASHINPNVYFEAGYALALNKYVVVFAPKGETMPFDLRSINRLPIDAADDPAGKEKVIKFMTGLRGLDSQA